jgi:hypothetical protein
MSQNTDGTAIIASAATASTPMGLWLRPLAWLLLPLGWPAGTPLTFQAAVTEAVPTADIDWHDVVDRFGSPVTLSGTAGQLVVVEPGLLMRLRHLRLKVATPQLADRSIQWGTWDLQG